MELTVVGIILQLSGIIGIYFYEGPILMAISGHGCLNNLVFA
jgi:hypothetical protein